MSTRIRKHIRDNVYGLIAIFIALGGTAYAAAELARNSVDSREIARKAVRDNELARDAVDSSKVGDGSLLPRDFAADQLPRGPRGKPGPAGEQGPPGPAGATTAIVRASDPLTVVPGEAGTVSADCETGEVATGGGVKFAVSEQYDIAGASYPRTAAGPAADGEVPTGWGGRVYNGTGSPKDAVAYAVCVSP